MKGTEEIEGFHEASRLKNWFLTIPRDLHANFQSLHNSRSHRVSTDEGKMCDRSSYKMDKGTSGDCATAFPGT